MRQLLAATILACTSLTGVPSMAADVNVSVQISQPGVYGRIDIGRFPQPQLVVQQPVIIIRAPVAVAVAPQPVYLWVPPGHRKDWRKHCGRYNACGVPVYFVRDDWYGERVHPKGKGHAGRQGDDRDEGQDRGKDHGKGKDKDKDKGKDHGKRD